MRLENAPKKDGTLKNPKLGLFIATSIVVGAVIGSGIFKKPAIMAKELGSPEALLIVWVVAGVVTLFGALTNAEISGMIPKTGGQYAYFQEMYGDFFAFLYGWAIFIVIQTGSIASIAYVFSHYAGYFFRLPNFPPATETSFVLSIPYIGDIYPLRDIGEKALTIGLILFLSAANYFGVEFGGKISGFFSSLKVLAVIAIAVLAVFAPCGTTENFTRDAPWFRSDLSLVGAFAMALSGAFWAYDGWNNVTYIGGELKNAKRNLPLALIIGTLIVIAVYALINLAYLYVLPVEKMAGSKLVASDLAEAAVGKSGGALVAAAVMISTFGAANGTILVSARVYYAMARDNLFYAPIGKIHPVFKTPANALIVQAIWSSVLVLSGTFDILTDMLIFVSWIFYAMGAYGVFVLRKKYPEAERTVKTWGYPLVPAIFVIFASIYVVLTLYTDIQNKAAGRTEIINSLFGLILTAAGAPVYLFYNRKKKKNKN